MQPFTRRAFLERTSQAFFVASLGPSLAASFERRLDDGDDLTFGPLEPLVDRLQGTSPGALQEFVLDGLVSGELDSRQLVAAAALANARAFGGEDYDGYHDFMALAPAFAIACELSGPARFVPLVKVIHRQAIHVGAAHAHERDRLHAGVRPEPAADASTLREAVLASDMVSAEQRCLTLVRSGTRAAFDAMQPTVRDTLDVHQIVLAQRAYEMVDFVGEEHAHTMLRQSVRHCVDRERSRVQRGLEEPPIRRDLPSIVAEYDLQSVRPGVREGDDAWLDELIAILYERSRKDAARAVASALSEGYAVEQVGEAISLAANAIHLRDRSQRTHGATWGVHACDSANAWRRMARVTSPFESLVTLVTAAYHTAHEKLYDTPPLPEHQHVERMRGLDVEATLRRADAAIRANDQVDAAACIAHLDGEVNAVEPIFALLRRYAVSEDGRLHAEKLYRTTREEFATVRPSRRWRFLIGLARSTASMFGYDMKDRPGHRAPGYEDACRRLGIESV